MKAIQVRQHGEADSLRVVDIPTPEPGPGEIRVRLHYAGVNFIDIYHRTGLYPVETPFTPGMEGAGIVEAVGPDVTGLHEGDRVAYAMQIGSYAEQVVLPAWKAVPVPDAVGLETAAAVMLQGMTAHYLVYSAYPLSERDVAVVHAAAGGVGLLLVQLASGAGATVIGTASTEEKVERARRAGAAHMVRYTEEDFREAVMRITEGRGADVVYDSVGRDTFQGSLDSLRPRGYLVLFGQSSGEVESFDPGQLNQKGSLFLTRPSLRDYAQDREEVGWRAGDLFAMIESDALSVRIHDTLHLTDAGRAHDLLERRETSGKMLLATDAA